MNTSLLECVLEHAHPWTIAPSNVIVDSLAQHQGQLPESVLRQLAEHALRAIPGEDQISGRLLSWLSRVIHALTPSWLDVDTACKASSTTSQDAWLPVMALLGAPETMSAWCQSWAKPPAWDATTPVSLHAGVVGVCPALMVWRVRRCTENAYLYADQMMQVPVAILASATGQVDLLEALHVLQPVTTLPRDTQAMAMMCAASADVARWWLAQGVPDTLTNDEGESLAEVWMHRGLDKEATRAWQGLVADHAPLSVLREQAIRAVDSATTLRMALARLPAEDFTIDGLHPASLIAMNIVAITPANYRLTLAEYTARQATLRQALTWQSRVQPGFPVAGSLDALVWQLAERALAKGCKHHWKNQKNDADEILSTPVRGYSAASVSGLLDHVPNYDWLIGPLWDLLPAQFKWQQSTDVRWVLLRFSQSSSHPPDPRVFRDCPGTLPWGTHPLDDPSAGHHLHRWWDVLTNHQEDALGPLVAWMQDRPQAWTGWSHDSLVALKDIWIKPDYAENAPVQALLRQAEDALLRQTLEATLPEGQAAPSRRLRL